MAVPYLHQPTAITAGVPQGRSFRTQYPDAKYPYRTGLQVYNRYTQDVLVTPNGDIGLRFRVAGGDVSRFPVDGSKRVIEYYTVDVASGVSSGTDIDINEYGGLDEP